MIEEKNKRLDYENEIIKNQNVQLVTSALVLTFSKNFARQNTENFVKLDQRKIN